MVRMFVRHEVADFGQWKKGYDSFDKERRGLGVVGDAVYRVANNGNDVIVTHDFETLEKAQTFVDSPRLKEVMAGAGVTGQPTVWFANPV
ncbi:MAG: cyclase [Acidobacteria bacterium]|jgi:hypothetical protein|nr:cyclase [Acidobacteriota bacterium]